MSADSSFRVVIDTIVYVLTRQVTLAYSVSSVPEEELQLQKLSFNSLLPELGKASSTESTKALTEREMVPPEKELDSNTVALLQQRRQNAAKALSKKTAMPNTALVRQRKGYQLQSKC